MHHYVMNLFLWVFPVYDACVFLLLFSVNLCIFIIFICLNIIYHSKKNCVAYPNRWMGMIHVMKEQNGVPKINECNMFDPKTCGLFIPQNGLTTSIKTIIQ
jgi:hypothetical protein